MRDIRSTRSSATRSPDRRPAKASRTSAPPGTPSPRTAGRSSRGPPHPAAATGQAGNRALGRGRSASPPPPVDGDRPSRCWRTRRGLQAYWTTWRLRRSDCQAARLARSSGLPFLARELDFAQPHVLRRYLHALVVADELQRLLQRQRPRRDQPHQLVRGRRAHVRQLLLLRRVHVQILGPRVLAHDHPLVDLDSRADEQLPPLLQVQQRERRRRAAPVGDQASRRPAPQLPMPRLVTVEHVMQDPRPARLRQELLERAGKPTALPLALTTRGAAARSTP